MATGNSNRDVRMTLSVDTLGEENIKKLQSTLVALAKEGGDAAPEFQRLADEIGRIGEQSAALQTFTTLAEQTADLAQRQEQASATAAELRTRLDALAIASQATVERQRQAAAALAEARQAARATRDELATLNATTSAAGKAEESYANEVQRLKLAKIEQRAEVERLAEALAKANQDVKAAEQAESKLAGTYRRAAAAADEAGRALAANATQVREAADAAQDLGVSTDDIASAQAELVQALNRTGRAAEDVQDRIARLAERERELAGIRAFQEQVDAASRLQQTAEYARLFDEALRRLAESERALESQRNAEQWQREAEALVNAAHAAQELARRTEVLSAAQHELAAQRAFERQAEDASKMLQAAEYVRFWREELDKADAQARATAEQAKLAAEKITGAFSTLGVRSAQDLRSEISQVRNAMETVRTSAGLTGGQLATAFAAGESRIKELERELRKVSGTMTVADQAARLFKNSIGQIAAGNIIADGVGYLVNKIKELAAAFVRTIIQTEQFRRALTAVYKDAKIAAQQFDFLKKVADSAGVSIGDIQQAFVRFSAATKASGISLQTTNQLFAEVARAAGTLGLSGEQVTGILEALGQMASKGTVSMEELRQQLGDRLPGALSLVAQGLGLTEAQLVKLVEGGGLAARDLFPALTKALSQMRGETDGLQPSWERFKNTLTQTAQTAGDAAWTDILTGALKALNVVVTGVAIVFSAFSEIVGVLGRSIGILVGSIVTLTNPMAELGRVTEEARKRHDKFVTSVTGGSAAAQEAAAQQAEQNKKLTEAGEAAATASGAIASTAKAQEAQAFAAKLAANGALDHSARLVQLTAYISMLLSAQQKEIEASGKLAKAAKIEGDSIVQLAELRGQQFLTMEAQVTSYEKQAAALAKVAEAHRVETELLAIQRDEIVKTALAQDGDLNGRKEILAEIDKKIVASQAETEQANQAAAAARNEAAVRRLAVQTYKDNAAAVGEFKAAMETAEATLARLIQGEKDGWATSEQVAVARLRAAEATHLYNDAIQDSIAALDRESRAKQANTNLTLTKIQIEERNYESMAAAARASGNYELALQFEVSARRKQIEAIRVSSDAKRLEAEATIKALEIERAALSQQDPMLKAKQQEIDTRIANARAKLLEANAGKDAIAALEREITLILQSRGAREGSRQGIDADTESRHRNADAIDRQTNALSKQKLTSDGFKANADGSAAGTFGNSVPTDIANAIIQKLNSGAITGGDLEFARAGAAQARNAKDWISAMPTGTVSIQALNDADALVRATQRALAIAQDRAGRAQEEKTSGAPVPGQPGEAPTGRGSTKTIDVKINGRSNPVTVASDTDANTLTSIIRQLESAAGASS
jgi:tape measure domain-containing protein